MKIMVFDVPAESGGALSVLNDYYHECKDNTRDEYVFVLSTPNLDEAENIKVLRYPWIKKSWLHRLIFDNFIAPKLIKKYKVDQVISLQNITIPHIKVNQILYVHNSLPFVDYKFSFRDNRLLWIYQNILSIKIYKSIKEAKKVIVQTDWMKKEIVRKLRLKAEKIDVISPIISEKITGGFIPTKKSMSTFFYPSNGYVYKNHKVIIDACKILKKENIVDYRVIFTLNGDENDNIINLYKEVKDEGLPIEFVGHLEKEKVFHFYSNSILLFPSFIESYGLPMLEAKLHKSLVVASNCPFSKEILDSYKNAYFFNPHDSGQLSAIIKNILNKSIKYIDEIELVNHK